jgi:hypothetical protein
MKLRKLFPLLLAVALIACVPTPGPIANPPTVQHATDTAAPPTNTSPSPTETATLAPSPTSAPDTNTVPSPTSAPPTPTGTPATCSPTDQDQFVYHPSRLQVLAACLRVTGVIAAIRNEADGDLHMLLKLDPEFVNLLTSANANEKGDLVIEPVCVKSVTQADAIAVCASDPDPLGGSFPSVGQHVWMEGRYVLDKDHGCWAELHPLYRWGPGGGVAFNTVPPVPTATRGLITLTPAPVFPTRTQAPAESTQPPAVSGFTLVSLSSPVGRGGNASATIQTATGAACSIGYVTPAGTNSTAQGLVSETADGSGVCAWTWKISSSTKPGTGTVTITANGSRQSFPIVIQ